MSRPIWMPRPLSDADAATLRRRAAARKPGPTGDPLVDLLGELGKQYPFRTRRLLRDLRWLEKEARKRGFTTQGG